MSLCPFSLKAPYHWLSTTSVRQSGAIALDGFRLAHWRRLQQVNKERRLDHKDEPLSWFNSIQIK
jgi:hypothetical protein